MFKIAIEQPVLNHALECLAGTVGNNSQNLGDDCISVTDNGDGTLSLFTSNGIDFSYIRVLTNQFNAQQGTPEVMPYVNFKRFRDIISTIPETIIVTIESKVNNISIGYGSKKPINLTGSTNGIIPLPKLAEDMLKNTNPGYELPDKSLYSICKAAVSIITDSKMNSITDCINLKFDNGMVISTGVDVPNSRMFHYDLKASTNAKGNVLVNPNKLLKSSNLFMSKDFSTDVVFYSDNNCTGFIKDYAGNKNTFDIMETMFITHNINGTFPANIENMFNGINEYAEVNMDELMNTLDRAKAIDDGTTASNVAHIEIASDTLKVDKRSQYGTVENSIQLENQINGKISDSFKIASLEQIMKLYKSVTPGTDFYIGEHSTPKGKYYVFKGDQVSTLEFLTTGFASSNTNNTNP